jgi:hypothetical protein
VSSPDAHVSEPRAALARVEIDRATTNSPAAAVERPDDLATAMAAVVRADQRDSALEVSAGETVGRDQGAEAPHTESGAAQEPTESGPAYDTLGRRDATAAQMREARLSEEGIAIALRADIANARPAADAVTAARAAPHATAGRSAGRGNRRPDRSR